MRQTKIKYSAAETKTNAPIPKKRSEKLRKYYASLYSSGGPKTFEINSYILTYPTNNVLITQR